MNVQIASAYIEESFNWKTWLKNGDQYFKAACPKGKKSRFTPELRYNLLSMALEGYAMAISDYFDMLPDNHTYTDLMDALERVIPLDPALRKKILAHESFQSICSLDEYQRSIPGEAALLDLTSAICEVAHLAHETCCPTPG